MPSAGTRSITGRWLHIQAQMKQAQAVSETLPWCPKHQGHLHQHPTSHTQLLPSLRSPGYCLLPSPSVCRAEVIAHTPLGKRLWSSRLSSTTAEPALGSTPRRLRATAAQLPQHAQHPAGTASHKQAAGSHLQPPKHSQSHQSGTAENPRHVRLLWRALSEEESLTRS